jgi:zinc/manganese transport system substrate-binding protein
MSVHECPVTVSRCRWSLVGALSVLAALSLVACGGGSDGQTEAATSVAAAAGCPSTPIPVVVTVNQWGDIVKQLAGACADVTTIITGTGGDPHDYEPSSADIAKFTDAQLVVVNGLDYDPWAEKAVAALSAQPAVINGGEVVGKVEGDNPHIWYGQDYVFAVADAVSAELKTLLPDAADYLDEQKAAWLESMKPYTAEIEAIKAAHAGRTYGATESIFDYMAEAVGLVNRTPQGYQNAAANESDPAPGDVNEFNETLTGGLIDVLVYNIQTEGSIPEQIRAMAEGASVPVVEVTESVPESADSFAQWQIDQLKSLSQALAG